MVSKNPLMLYQRIAATTSQMLAAAQEQDWELLTELEMACAEYVEALKSIETTTLVSPEIARQKVAYIKSILENDKKIRHLVSPWMNRLNSLINSRQIEQKLSQAYRQ